jgi:ParB family transcriptional regulator, chromosome partitioning protein
VSVKRSGLGRGLGALIPTSPTGESGSVLRDIPLSQIRPNQHQPRSHFDEEALSSLVDSIKGVGVIQPVLVRQTEDGFELIAGERRCRAARRAGLQTIPAVVQTADDAASLERALVENLHREDLNALEEAAAYKQLIEDFHLTHEEVSQKVGRSRAAVTNSLRLFQLPPSLQRRIRDGELSSGHARALLMTPDRELQEELGDLAVVENLSVRALEELVRSKLHDDSDDLGEVDGVDGAQRKGTSVRPAGILELEQLLADRLSTRVQVDITKRRGRILIEFADITDLERIYRSMLPVDAEQ